MPWDVTTTKPRLRIPSTARKRVAERVLFANLDNMGERKDGRGEPLPRTEGDNVDLYESGDLQGDVDADEDGYRFLAPYAEHVDKRYGFAFTEDTELEDGVERDIEDILDGEDLELEEEEG